MEDVPVSDSEFAGDEGDDRDGVDGRARGMVEMTRSCDRGRELGYEDVDVVGVEGGDWDIRSEEHSCEEPYVVGLGRGCGRGGCEGGSCDSGCVCSFVGD